ncbi:MAG TPA: MarR family winged helix-turn-helix transcriptional regulator [Alphaproteobacteria bacterium]|nr:MarR family winged helix-turn-helix transcriptional regulator [Alphaproteobacteria bacterium]
MSQTTIDAPEQAAQDAPKQAAQAPFDLDRFIPYLLTRITGRLGNSLAGALRPLRMTNKQWRVLAVLSAEDGRTISELCAYTAVDHSTLSRVVDRLVDEGQVERVPSPDDARSTQIKLTDRGRETFHALLPIAIAQANWAISGIDQAELDQVTATLRKMLNNIRVSPYP